MEKKTPAQRIVMAALLASLTCVATMIVKIPSPLKGYLNLGDCVVLLAGWQLSPMFGFLSAGIGSALADLFSGYAVYAPATFIIKGLMALIAFHGCRLAGKRFGSFTSRLISSVLAETGMVLGYLIFESCLYGFVPSLVNIPANMIQGAAGLVMGIVLAGTFEKNKITF